MENQKYSCFFIMPFRSELNYFYLYLRDYFEDKHAIKVERGDHAVLTIALLEKIKMQIEECDFLVAEITDSNANVFYEMGIAHANKKPIIFITQDKPENAPVDIRQFEVINYSLSDETNLLKSLDNAIQNLFKTDFDELHSNAVDLLNRFNEGAGSNYVEADREEFQARVMRGTRSKRVPEDKEGRAFAEFVLPKIVSEATDISLMKNLTSWLDGAFENDG